MLSRMLLHRFLLACLLFSGLLWKVGCVPPKEKGGSSKRTNLHLDDTNQRSLLAASEFLFAEAGTLKDVKEAIGLQDYKRKPHKKKEAGYYGQEQWISRRAKTLIKDGKETDVEKSLERAKELWIERQEYTKAYRNRMRKVANSMDVPQEARFLLYEKRKKLPKGHFKKDNYIARWKENFMNSKTFDGNEKEAEILAQQKHAKRLQHLAFKQRARRQRLEENQSQLHPVSPKDAKLAKL